MDVGQNQWYPFGVGEFTTHFRTYFSGWIRSRSLGANRALDFDPWPCDSKVINLLMLEKSPSDPAISSSIYISLEVRCSELCHLGLQYSVKQIITSKKYHINIGSRRLQVVRFVRSFCEIFALGIFYRILRLGIAARFRPISRGLTLTC